MSGHARPHLQTHRRSDDHSAVAGAAYCLGLCLHDERLNKTYDFSHRRKSRQVVDAFMVAPAGLPAWVNDPQQLWNRVEAAEKRRDAQVARDYRLPIPFGLSEPQASEFAREMAHFIVSILGVPVAVGLHQDADVDALGVPKPAEKVGLHAHLYFPTRLMDGVGGGFGSKLSVLSNPRSSSIFVDAMNERWAKLANTYTGALDLRADYDHRSYKKIGQAATPQPTLGPKAVAMERRGVKTYLGNEVRARNYGSALPLHSGPAISVNLTHTLSTARRLHASADARTGRVAVKARSDVSNPASTPLARQMLASGPHPKNDSEWEALERSVCSGQLTSDTGLSFSSATAGARPPLN